MVPMLLSPNGTTFRKVEDIIWPMKGGVDQGMEKSGKGRRLIRVRCKSLRLQPTLSPRILGQTSRWSRWPLSPTSYTCRSGPISWSLVHRLSWLIVSLWIFVSYLQLFSSWQAYMACNLSLYRFNRFLRSLQRGQVWVAWKGKTPVQQDARALAKCTLGPVCGRRCWRSLDLTNNT